ncbi:type IV secretory system conjugative DNA transfer family protein [Peribacillus simplex]|uniref:VirD4-like conjugal transfer protein, CD1115 family n=1 Tax=Peribacillus simplex TaxID=1478 RepID=UPI00298E6C0C|nr:type IV secretory system conjugative DNA transfer family protein [Peribacillus simplex]MDW7617363.1 type IV secretory system conjugative DNA transfer family protein [Peribacillus simplex]
MDITKDKFKKAAILGTVTGAGLEYVSAASVQSFEYIKNYQFEKFWDTINYNLGHPISNITNALSTDTYTSIQPFILVGTVFVAGKFLLNQPIKYEDASDYGAYGTARWARKEEIYNPEDITSDINKPGTIHGRNKGQVINQHNDSYLNRNILLVGGSGAGKTRSNIITNILKNKEKSQVIVDPKGELYEKTSQIKREQGYKVRLINFKDRDKSDRYNLFDYIRRDSDAFKIADAIVSNAAEGDKVKKDFWNQSQIAVLQALMTYVRHALPKEQQHMGSVMNLANCRYDVIKYLFEQWPREHIVNRSYQTAVSNLSEKTGPDVFQTLMGTLNPWLYDDVCRFTETNDFLFEELGKKKIIVYVIIPIADNEFKPLITTFFTQLFSELYRLADLNYGELPQPVWLALDEFANIGKLPEFEKRLSTTRSLGIEVTIIIQDTSQLESRYGKDLAKEIISNCDIRILLKANEPETAKYFSRLAGKTTIRITNKSSSKSSKSSSRSESVQYMGRDLITEGEVMGLKRNDQLLFIAGYKPMKVQKAWFNKIKDFKKMMKGKKVSREDYEGSERLDYQIFIPPTVDKINVEIEKAQIAEAMENENKSEEEFFVPFETADGSVVDTETGEILEQMNQPDFSDYDAPPENDPYAFEDSDIPPEPKKEISVDDLGGSFKF